MSPAAQHLQALLFVAGEAVSKQELLQLLGTDEAVLQSTISELTGALADQGLALVTTSTHVQLVTAPAVGQYLAAWRQEEFGPLTAAAAETLAIVAYRGPISRYEIDLLRGVDCRSILRHLMRRGIVRRVQQAGRTPLYDVTEDFLMHLGITRREDLPDFATLANAEAIERILNK